MKRLIGLALVVVCAWSCGGQSAVIAVPAPPNDLVALLPDPETGTVGRVVVSSRVGGSVELSTDKAGTRIAAGQPPSGPFTLTEPHVQQVFGEALAARPPAPRHFHLYFEAGSNQLTAESHGVIRELLAFIKSRTVPDVTVIGHTDTTGDAPANVELGRARGSMIRDRLVAVGLEERVVSVASHGEADLLVPTPDETPEPKNRRVEVSVR